MGRPKSSGAGPECHLYKHGGTGTRLYRIWKGMRKRCYDPKEPAFARYGAVGISICSEWLSDFAVFRAWALGNGYQDNLTIDRIENSAGYSPNNCRWATYKQQNQNKSNINRYPYNGRMVSIPELVEQFSLSYDLLKGRIATAGWTVERAVTTVPRALKSA